MPFNVLIHRNNLENKATSKLKIQVLYFSTSNGLLRHQRGSLFENDLRIIN